MTVETASYISQLNTSWPQAVDLISEGDDHIKLTKTVLKTQFPNFGTTAINATAAEVNYLVGVTSSIQTQINSKSNTASPTFTGTVVLPSTTSIGTVSSAEIGYLGGVTSAIQTQIDGKASIATTNNLQTQIDAKAPSASPTFTGTVVLPSATSIGTVSSTELGYLDGVTSSIQTQIDSKGAIAGQTWTGTHNYTGATVTVPTATAGDSSTKAASTAFVAGVAFSTALPAQTGNAGKFVTTNGTTASWADVVTSVNGLTGAVTVVSSVNGQTGAVTIDGAPQYLIQAAGVI